MERDKAAFAFIKKVVSRGYTSAVAITTQKLEKEPTETYPLGENQQLHAWYEQLDVNDQDMIKQVIKEAVFSAVFGCLVVLDNSTTGYVLENEVSDIALYVRKYADSESYSLHKISDSIQINDLMDLHEMLRENIKK